jgi:hypothetical protein
VTVEPGAIVRSQVSPDTPPAASCAVSCATTPARRNQECRRVRNDLLSVHSRATSPGPVNGGLAIAMVRIFQALPS